MKLIILHLFFVTLRHLSEFFFEKKIIKKLIETQIGLSEHVKQSQIDEAVINKNGVPVFILIFRFKKMSFERSETPPFITGF